MYVLCIYECQCIFYYSFKWQYILLTYLSITLLGIEIDWRLTFNTRTPPRIYPPDGLPPVYFDFSNRPWVSYFIYKIEGQRVRNKLVSFCQIYYFKLYTIEISGFNHCNMCLWSMKYFFPFKTIFSLVFYFITIRCCINICQINSHLWAKDKSNIYIGRSHSDIGFSSPWSNPHKMSKNSPSEHFCVVQLYQDHLIEYHEY